MKKEEWVRERIEALQRELRDLDECSDPDGQHTTDIQQELAELRAWQQEDW